MTFFRWFSKKRIPVVTVMLLLIVGSLKIRLYRLKEINQPKSIQNTQTIVLNQGLNTSTTRRIRPDLLVDKNTQNIVRNHGVNTSTTRRIRPDLLVDKNTQNIVRNHGVNTSTTRRIRPDLLVDKPGNKKYVKPTSKKKLILWYNPPSYVRLSPSFNPMQLCPKLNCEFTHNKDTLKMSDVVIIDVHALPTKSPIKWPHQKWVFFTQEAPPHISHRKLNTDAWRNKFDLTATYRRDSDVPTPYGVITGVKRNNLKRNYTEIFRGKKRAAAWIVSHCITEGKRESIVSELRKFFRVDIFGGCGKTICSRYKDSRCLKEKVNEYMFYISFENTLCRDYVTEKFFRYYSYDTIQIVRGGMNYSDIAPAGTFIDYSDFKSTKKLASFLKNLANNEEQYIAYLKRKDGYESLYEEYSYMFSQGVKYVHSHYFNRPLCDLCKLSLNTSQPTSNYTDIYNWFYTNECKKPIDVGL